LGIKGLVVVVVVIVEPRAEVVEAHEHSRVGSMIWRLTQQISSMARVLGPLGGRTNDAVSPLGSVSRQQGHRQGQDLKGQQPGEEAVVATGSHRDRHLDSPLTEAHLRFLSISLSTAPSSQRWTLLPGA
jgi:hypothetical protein